MARRVRLTGRDRFDLIYLALRDPQAMYVGGRAVEGGSPRSAARTLRALSSAAARRSMCSTCTAALRRNRSTLALVWVSERLSADGLIARFRKAGYAVIEPHQAAEQPALR